MPMWTQIMFTQKQYIIIQMAKYTVDVVYCT